MPKLFTSKWTKFSIKNIKDEYDNDDDNNIHHHKHHSESSEGNSLVPQNLLGSSPSVSTLTNPSLQKQISKHRLKEISSFSSTGANIGTDKFITADNESSYSQSSSSPPTLSHTSWRVWKFGGTSMGSFERITNVAKLISRAMHSFPKLVIVVSAVGGITNKLQACCDKALEQYKILKTHTPVDDASSYIEDLEAITQKHYEIIEQMYLHNHIDENQKRAFEESMTNDIVSITSVLTVIELSGKLPKDLNDFVIGQAEIWSSKLLHLCLPYYIRKTGALIYHQNASDKIDTVLIEGVKSFGTSGCPTLSELGIHQQQYPKPSTDQYSSPDHPPNLPNNSCHKSSTNSNHIDPSPGTTGTYQGISSFPYNIDDANFYTQYDSISLQASSHINQKDYTREISLHLFDTREFLIVFDRSTPESAYWSLDYAKNQALLDWTTSQNKLNAHFEEHLGHIESQNNVNKENISQLIVMTGFICSYPDGTMTTLGRNGSDYSASIISALLNASELTIWSDVNGIYSADPRMVHNASLVRYLTYKEAMELSYFGAKVLHPFSIHPCVRTRIPILLKNSFDPDAPGTTIGHHDPTGLDPHMSDFPCKAITTIQDISLITLEATHMIGVPGIASKLFSSLNACNCSVLLISQGSSEHSICLALRSSELKSALLGIHNAFKMEIEVTNSMSLYYDEDCTILSAVGGGMSGYMGILAKLSFALSSALVNVKAVTQGPGEHNISFVIDEKDTTKGLIALHNSILPSPHRNNFQKQKQPLIILTTTQFIELLKNNPLIFIEFTKEIQLTSLQKTQFNEKFELLAITDGQLITFLLPNTHIFETQIRFDFWDQVNARDDLDAFLWDLTSLTETLYQNKVDINNKTHKDTFLYKWNSEFKPIISPSQHNIK